MPRHTTLPVPKNDWVEFTAGDVTDITFQNVGRNFVLVQGTAEQHIKEGKHANRWTRLTRDVRRFTGPASLPSREVTCGHPDARGFRFAMR